MSKITNAIINVLHAWIIPIRRNTFTPKENVLTISLDHQK
jgi:hypothetical protein